MKIIRAISLSILCVFLLGCNMNPNKEARIQTLESEAEGLNARIKTLEDKIDTLTISNQKLSDKINALGKK